MSRLKELNESSCGAPSSQWCSNDWCRPRACGTTSCRVDLGSLVIFKWLHNDTNFRRNETTYTVNGRSRLVYSSRRKLIKGYKHRLEDPQIASAERAAKADTAHSKSMVRDYVVSHCHSSRTGLRLDLDYRFFARPHQALRLQGNAIIGVSEPVAGAAQGQDFRTVNAASMDVSSGVARHLTSPTESAMQLARQLLPLI